MLQHRLRGSARLVLTATGFVNGKRQFSTPYRIDTPQSITIKFVKGDYVSDPYSWAKFGAHPSTWGFWTNGWNITKNIFIYTPFVMNIFYRSYPSTDFHAWWLKWCGNLIPSVIQFSWIRSRESQSPMPCTTGLLTIFMVMSIARHLVARDPACSR